MILALEEKWAGEGRPFIVKSTNRTAATMKSRWHPPSLMFVLMFVLPVRIRATLPI